MRGRVDEAFWRLIEATAPEVHGRLRDAPRTSRYHATRGWPGYVRRSSGPGWALVGDAAHFKDPLSAHGLTDALRDAELLARAAHDGLEDPAVMAEGLTRYERRRDALSLPLLATADAIASYSWSMVEIREHLLALSAAMRDEVTMLMQLDQTDGSDPGSWLARDRQAVGAGPA